MMTTMGHMRGRRESASVAGEAMTGLEVGWFAKTSKVSNSYALQSRTTNHEQWRRDYPPNH
jgi:hypothetical protein